MHVCKSKAGCMLNGLPVHRRRRYNGHLPPTPAWTSESAPGVSILRPLSGLDCNLADNLESSFRQVYPTFELLLSVTDEADAAIPIVRELMAKYPDVDARLIIGAHLNTLSDWMWALKSACDAAGAEEVGVNPKVNNLIRSYRAAKYDILWVLDSNVLTTTTTLARSVALLTSRGGAPEGEKSLLSRGGGRVGLVHHVPFAIFADDLLGARVEQAFLGTTHAKMYLAINKVAVDSCVMGKSCLFRRTDIESAAQQARLKVPALKASQAGAPTTSSSDASEGGELNGLATFGQYLGEDNMIGRAIWHDLGLRHAMGSDVAGNAVGHMDLNTYFRRRVRWIRVRKYMVLYVLSSAHLAYPDARTPLMSCYSASTLLEPLTENVVVGLLLVYALIKLLELGGDSTRAHALWGALIFCAHLLLVYSIDARVYEALNASSPAQHSRSHLPHHSTAWTFTFARAWLVRELLALPVWLFAMLGNTVVWRAGADTFLVNMDGTVRSLASGEQEGLAERVFQRVVHGRRPQTQQYERLPGAA